jgi:RHS repeat-associated protein
MASARLVGLDFFGARYFSGAQGRFTSPDPIVHPAQSEAGFETFISEPQRWNKYAYVSNNPLKYTDPNGAEQVVGCIGGTCYNNVTGQVIPRQSTPDMLRTAAIPVAGMAAAAGGSWLASAWQGLTALVLGTAPTTVPIVNSLLEGLTPGQSLTAGRAEQLGVTAFEKVGESGFVGSLANGAKISAGFEQTGSALGVNISNIETAARGSISFRGLEAGAVNIAKSEGASSVTITAKNVVNAKLGGFLTKAGYTAQKVTDNFGRETVNYVKKIQVGN